jgi:hypothetical protein
MSWQSEFRSQWRMLTQTLETRVRKDLNRQKTISPAEINAHLDAEKTKWYSSSHYNGAWLRKLKAEYPEVGEQFQASLEGIWVETGALGSGKRSLRDIAIIGALVSAGFLPIMMVLASDYTPWMKLLGVLACIAVAGTMIFVYLDSAFKRVRSAALGQLQEELNRIGKALEAVAIKADVGGRAGSVSTLGVDNRS